jgi:hypothetical protein
MKRSGSASLNVLSLVLLGLTAILFICYFLVLINPQIGYNPFPPRLAEVTPSVQPTPTRDLPPTWTPTSMPTTAPTWTPRPTRTPTRIPGPSPTWPPTRTPTPQATRSTYPFTCEILYRRPEYDSWTGVAGHFEDLNGDPLPGYHAQVQCPGVGTFTPRAGDDSRYNLMYDHEAAWEQACNPSRYQAMEIRVQMFNDRPDPNGEYRPVSEQLYVDLGGFASRSLGYIVCTLNWDEWQ